MDSIPGKLALGNSDFLPSPPNSYTREMKFILQLQGRQLIVYESIYCGICLAMVPVLVDLANREPGNLWHDIHIRVNKCI
jgi:hypothetical protein